MKASSSYRGHRREREREALGTTTEATTNGRVTVSGSAPPRCPKPSSERFVHLDGEDEDAQTFEDDDEDQLARYVEPPELPTVDA